MPISKGFATLMLREETKDKFKECKKKMEQQLGVSLTYSQALDFLSDQILSDSISLKLKITPIEEE